MALVLTTENLTDKTDNLIATFDGQVMNAVSATDSGLGAQGASIFYLINPDSTEGIFEVFTDSNLTNITWAYSAISLSGAPGIAGQDTVGSTTNSADIPLEVSYTTATDNGFVITAAVNNDHNGGRPLSLAYGNANSSLLDFVTVGSSGHFHPIGRIESAGEQFDGYLGQYQRTAVATLAFGVASVNDQDSDLLNDFWEDEHFGDASGTIEESDLTPQNGSGDPDSDLASNEQEETAGTDPNVPDSDGDGLTDGEEINTHNTLPLVADSDADGIGDAEEVTAGNDGFITNALSSDTDSDGLSDSWEILNGLDPTDGSGDQGGSGDPDSDNLTNAEELLASTNPTSADSDNDGLTDAEEINTTLTDPLLADSDADGLLDGEEVTAGSDPLSEDGDGDGFSDATELAVGTDPNDGALFPENFITETNSAAGLTANEAFSNSDTGVIFTSASFALNGGNFVALFFTAEGIGGNGALPTATFAGQAMTALHAQDPGVGAQTATVFYLHNPSATEGVFEVSSDPGLTALSYAYSQLALSNVSQIAASLAIGSTETAPATALELDYEITNNDGFVLSAAANNDFNNSRILSVASGNPDTDLLPHAVIGSSGHFHSYGQVGPAGSHQDLYLGQYQRTAIASLVLGSPVAMGEGIEIISSDYTEGTFQVTYSGLDPEKNYQWMISSPGLNTFTPLGDAFSPTGSSESLSDLSPPAEKAFYRLSELP
ncbi:hypothetical protein [Roseibacillus ishigakijimensis]|uniref:Uncharacterized protein n=1 Tax=Roseibacillus ishigakijimensis TaxID=454146 RepID=A0A934RPQ3_9BACT|nr:hypothetical protein [Roseibacillus ishigakijimensis]MBK1835214.1 hypothetical protein [Roseibacillus ishigakijimensis]